jgi:hypothetical protein
LADVAPADWLARIWEIEQANDRQRWQQLPEKQRNCSGFKSAAQKFAREDIRELAAANDPDIQ